MSKLAGGSKVFYQSDANSKEWTKCLEYVNSAVVNVCPERRKLIGPDSSPDVYQIYFNNIGGLFNKLKVNIMINIVDKKSFRNFNDIYLLLFIY